ncbi:hypothetical protein CAEBREN_07373 [Caenorhabditis brenneri]|uniref:G-protein coupled receptors family 1 profile domain-containing protein n=1 Tax=Caenorhabditis brenneri TaxID=135651 RepID=G0MUD1_CAEBE|nr:hypothetical protein CAEBREN_07373 [Caenorhabditis brenneri]
MDESYCGLDDFPGYSNSSVRFFCSFLTWLNEFTDELSTINIYIYLASILINLLHFSILVKKSMRSSSINLLMAAVAICDIFSQFNGVFWNVKNYLEAQESCKTDIYWYSITLAENKFLWLQDSMRRYSTWLSFSIAFIRTLVVRYPMSTLSPLCLPSGR